MVTEYLIEKESASWARGDFRMIWAHQAPEPMLYRSREVIVCCCLICIVFSRKYEEKRRGIEIDVSSLLFALAFRRCSGPGQVSANWRLPRLFYRPSLAIPHFRPNRPQPCLLKQADLQARSNHWVSAQRNPPYSSASFKSGCVRLQSISLESDAQYRLLFGFNRGSLSPNFRHNNLP